MPAHSRIIPMSRKFFRKYLPSHQSVRDHKYLGRLGRFLNHPNLWHLNRRSVSGGVAVGLFSGLVPGPLQMFTAALLAIPLRVNLPIALAMTLYTNPLTIVPLYVAAYFLGSALTGEHSHMAPPPEFSWSQIGPWLHATLEWTASLGTPLIVGLLTMALGLALIGYVAVQVGWRLSVALAWRRRRARRAGGH
jgi:uncharacterized protein (DUF2062 family)